MESVFIKSLKQGIANRVQGLGKLGQSGLEDQRLILYFPIPQTLTPIPQTLILELSTTMSLVLAVFLCKIDLSGEVYQARCFQVVLWYTVPNTDKLVMARNPVSKAVNYRLRIAARSVKFLPDSETRVL